MNRPRLSTFLFSLLLTVYLIYAAVFIYQTIIVVNDKPYAVLFDDAMISMQYARNLAQGNGAVFNAGGEHVEGYSNPLWVAFMALFHLLPIPVNWMSLPVQISGALFLAVNLWFVWKIALLLMNKESTGEGNWLAILATVFLTAFFYPLNQWGLLGLEVSLLTLLISLTVWMVLRCVKERRFNPWVYVLLGISTLLRIDMLAIGLVTLVFLAWVDVPNRRKHIVWGLGILTAFFFGQTIVRYLYYGDWLPNTYYLKMTGVSLSLRIERGAYVFLKFVWNFNIVLFMLPFLILLFRRDKGVCYLFLLIVVQVAYSVYVGGDAWEHRGGSNRFISAVMPLFMVLFVLTLEEIRQAVLTRAVSLPDGLAERWLKPLSQAILAFFTLISLVNFNALLDTDSLQYAILRKPSIYVIGQEKILRIALFVKEITTPQASVLAIAAGGVPYFSERTTYDLLGKSDRLVAREQMHFDLSQGLVNGFRPGHNKWDYAYSIGELKPDIIPEVWQGTQEEVLPYLKDYTVIQMEEFKRWLPNGVMYVRTGSANVRWELIQPYIVPVESIQENSQ
jgi:hypothetical protein